MVTTAREMLYLDGPPRTHNDGDRRAGKWARGWGGQPIPHASIATWSSQPILAIFRRTASAASAVRSTWLLELNRVSEEMWSIESTIPFLTLFTLCTVVSLQVMVRPSAISSHLRRDMVLNFREDSNVDMMEGGEPTGRWQMGYLDVRTGEAEVEGVGGRMR